MERVVAHLARAAAKNPAQVWASVQRFCKAANFAFVGIAVWHPVMKCQKAFMPFPFFMLRLTCATVSVLA